MKKSLRIVLFIFIAFVCTSLIILSPSTSPHLISTARASGSTRLYLPLVGVNPQPLSPFPDLCEPTANDYHKGNVLKNCGFADGLDHWKTKILAGDPSVVFDPAGHAYYGHSVRIDAGSDFRLVLYQQYTSAQTNEPYYANVNWLVWPSSSSRNKSYRKVGIDPTGGTDPNSASVIWGKEVDTPIDNCDNKICTDLYVIAAAKSTTITYYLWIDDDNNGNTYWIDDVGMIKLER